MNVAENVVIGVFVVNLLFFVLFMWIPAHFYKIPMLRLVTGGSAAILALWIWWDDIYKFIFTMR